MSLLSPAGTALVRQQPALALDPAAIADQAAGTAHDAVAGYHEADRVAPVGGTHRPRRARQAEMAGELAVAARPARRDLAQGRPDAPLERRAAAVGGDVRKRVEPVVEIGPDSGGEALR